MNKVLKISYLKSIPIILQAGMAESGNALDLSQIRCGRWLDPD